MGCGKVDSFKENGIQKEMGKDSNEDKGVSNKLMEKLEIPSVDAVMEWANEDILSENDLEPENISQISEKDFRKLLKRLCRFEGRNWNYEIYVIDNMKYALVVIQSGSNKVPFWLYQEEGEWHLGNFIVPEEVSIGQFDYAEFHWIESWGKTVLIMQTASNQGNGDTYAFLIEDNQLKCIGYGLGRVCRHRATFSSTNKTDFYANEGRAQVAFQDINGDEIPEMLVYGRKLIYMCTPKEIKNLIGVEIEKRAYEYKNDSLSEIENPQYDTKNLSNETTEKCYHLWGLNADVDSQIMEVTEVNGTEALYSLNWEKDKLVVANVPIEGSEIYKTEIMNRYNVYCEPGEMSLPFIATEQISEKGRIYQIFAWEKEGLREVFVDEYRNYSLIDEEIYMTGEQYNTYGCDVYEDILYIAGARLVMDEEGTVSGIDSKARKYRYENGYFQLEK